jgi:hypothetical protein
MSQAEIVAKFRAAVADAQRQHRRTVPAYVCSEPGCGQVFTDPEPDEAWAQYDDHQDTHDVPNDYVTIAEVTD